MVSVSVPVDPSCKYDNLACFSTFGDTVQFVGGINKPKLVQCFDRCCLCTLPAMTWCLILPHCETASSRFRQLANFVLFYVRHLWLLHTSKERNKRCCVLRN